MNVYYINPTDSHCLRSPETLGNAYGKVYTDLGEAEAALIDPMNDDLDETAEVVECDLHELPDDLFDAGREATGMRCECHMAHSDGPCYSIIPAGQTNVIEYTPEHLRASHTAARNTGVYPYNGNLRIRCHPVCAESILESDPEWSWRVE